MTIAVVLLATVAASAEPPENPVTIGNIYIEGNTDTPDSAILPHLDLYSGQKLNPAALVRAQQRLRASGLFKLNPWRGTGPTIQALPNDFDHAFVDILVRVEERPGNWLPFGLLEVMNAAMHLEGVRVIYSFGMLCRRAMEAFGTGR